MKNLLRFLGSSIGTKLVISLTGLAMFLFLVGHLAGNLLMFLGPESYNHYADKLIKNPLLIPTELGLIAVFVIHLYKTVTMTWRNRQARPEGYRASGGAGGVSRKSIASSTMIFSGLFLAVFVPLHIKTFKYGAHYDAAEAGVRDLYRLVIEVFQQPLYAVFYVVSMIVLGFHLRHGFSSAFQSLGADHPVLTPRIVALGKVLAVVMAAGFASIPLWVAFFSA